MLKVFILKKLIPNIFLVKVLIFKIFILKLIISKIFILKMFLLLESFYIRNNINIIEYISYVINYCNKV